MSGREKAPRAEGRKKRAEGLGAPVVHQGGAKGVTHIGGRLAPDPRRVAENLRTYLPPEQTYPRDLFGEAVSPGRGRSGRPRHIPTPATRARVVELRAEGLNIHAVAREMGLSQPTLQLNYPVELGSGSRTWRRRVVDNAQAGGPATLTKKED